MIKIEGAPSYESKSRVGLALVVVAPADNLFEVARGKLDRDSQVFTRTALIPDETSDKENDDRNAKLMTSSQEDATYVALKYLGYDVKASGKGARIVRVADGMPATGVVQVDDVIKSVDGQEVAVSDDAVRLVVAREVGAPAHTGLIADDAFQRAQAQGWGQIGFPVVARILEAMAGVELRAAVSAEEARYEDRDPRRT